MAEKTKEAELLEEIKKLKEENAAIKAENSSKDELLAEAVKEIDESAKSGKELPVFTVDKNKYALVVPKSTYNSKVKNSAFNGKPLTITAKLLKEKPALAKELVSIGAGCLVLQEELQPKGKEK